MNQRVVWLVLSWLAVFIGLNLHAAEIDLSGTWEGETFVPNSQLADKVTLILQKKNGQYSGTLSDAFGIAVNTQLTGIQFVAGRLSFSFTVFNGVENVNVSSVLTVEVDKMTGNWSLADGTSGTITLKKRE